MSRALVHGLAVTGVATTRALARHGYEVVVTDDEVTPERREVADQLGVELLPTPAGRRLHDLVASCALVSPAPGVPETHDVVLAAEAAAVPILSEIELAYRWEQTRAGGPRPMLAVTGTDGKTTTTLLTVEMLRAAGLRTVDAGNTATPLVDAIEQELDAYVVECTSFRLAWTTCFRAEGAAWLNLAPDHLNWHRTMASYEAAKARIFRHQRADDVAVGFVDDPVVMRYLASAPARRRTFGLARGDYRVEGSGDGAVLVGPAGTIAPVAAMRRSLPHDVTNALAAAALVIESGLADEAAVAVALATFRGPPHRLEEIGEWSGVAWFNDSKATTPHAAAAAIRSFDRIVLIAGGYDKHVDLAPMAADADRVRVLLTVGATADDVASVFAGVPEIRRAGDLETAVDLARRLARAGDTVLLSPGCASLDQYPNFEARGDHFRRLVLDAHGGGASDVSNGGLP
jgi:UDP-N-acetylmuramoylalanine--D-glutamate ligase